MGGLRSWTIVIDAPEKARGNGKLGSRGTLFYVQERDIIAKDTPCFAAGQMLVLTSRPSYTGSERDIGVG